MSTNVEFPPLPPAKPYEGVSQHQAVRAAIRRLVKAGLLAKDEGRFTQGAAVAVSGRGRVRDEQSNRWCDVVKMCWVPPRRAGTEPKVTMDQVAAWLRSAGWTVFDAGRFCAVYGPGLSDWVDRQQARERERREREEARAAQEQADRKELVGLLARLGVDGFVSKSPGGRIKAEVSLAEVRKIVAMLPDGGDV